MVAVMKIVRATRLIANKVANNELKPEDINQSIFEEHLFTRGIPDPDLVIRTSGEKECLIFFSGNQLTVSLFLPKLYGLILRQSV